MKKQSKRNWLALLGIGAGAWAFWKYRNMPPEEKEKLKSKLTDAGNKLKETVEDIEADVTDTYTQAKRSLENEIKK
ncbi:MAG TPA: YtxH domain-containing protein [Pricia sp.]|nr:YtxH domain-containing protein [Pricia sp.]